MVASILRSPVSFRLLLAIPAVVILAYFVAGARGYGYLITSLGEWSVRLLVASLAITPLRMMFRRQRWPMWLFRRRRDLGVAAFLYAAGHLAAYVLKERSLQWIVGDLAEPFFVLGWIAFAVMAVPFATSNQWALRNFGTWWKPIQRLVYVATVAAFGHWLLAGRDWLPAAVHLAPLALLEGYRMLYVFRRRDRRGSASRPSSRPSWRGHSGCRR